MHTWKACFPTCISEPFLVVLQTSLLHIPEQPRGQNHISESLLSSVYILTVFVFLKHSYYTFYPLNPLSKPQWKMFTAK